jgi:hypothetical protein
LQTATGALRSDIDSNDTEISVLQTATGVLRSDIDSNDTDIYTLQTATGDLQTNKSSVTVTGSSSLSSLDITGVGNVTVTLDGSTAKISGAAGGGGGAPTDASYIVVGANGTLSEERVLTAGTGIIINDGGANGNFTISTSGHSHGGDGGGISFDGSTANGVLTYKDSDEASVESNITFDNTVLNVSGSITGQQISGQNIFATYLYTPEITDLQTATGTLRTDVDSNDTGISELQTATGDLQTNKSSVTVTGSSSLSSLDITGVGNVTVTLDGSTAKISGAAGGGSSYTAGTGLTLVGTEFNTDNTGYFDELNIVNGGDINLGEDQRIYFESDKGSYIESNASDRIRLVAGGSQMMVWDQDNSRVVFGYGQKVYIGSNNNAIPEHQLEVAGAVSGESITGQQISGTSISTTSLSLNGNYKDTVYNSGTFISDGTLHLDLNGKSSQKMILSGHATNLELMNIEEGREVSLMVSGADTDYTFCSGSNIHFIGAAPKTVRANKIAVLTVKSFGTTTGECVGAFAVQD